MSDIHIMEQGIREEGFYFACEQPERPHSSLTSYEDRCRGCMIAAEAHIRMGNGDAPGITTDGIVSHTGQVTTLEIWYNSRMKEGALDTK